ncbi:MAG: hypothetical protein H6510_12345 [Acidobacteria bacterium]|nr:hypothetical protein [Acidobacteriota bacterium]
MVVLLFWVLFWQERPFQIEDYPFPKCAKNTLRYRASNSADPNRRRIFSYDGSQLIALGEQYLNPTTHTLEFEWQYAIGHGELSECPERVEGLIWALVF